MLPESKSDFPKCLYLDQNKWIDLARAHFEKPGGEKFKPCLDAIRGAIKSGKLIVPFSIVNAIETIIAEDEGRRKRLAEFMVDLSGNRTLAPDNVVAAQEIANAVRALFGIPATEVPRKSLVQVGIMHAAGLTQEFQGIMPPFLNAAFGAFMSRPEATIDYLAGLGGQRGHINTARDGEAKARDIFEADRAVTTTMGLVERQRAEMSGLFQRIPEYQAALNGALRSIGRPVADFNAEMKSDEKLTQFIAAIPNLDVFITLRIAREKDKDREVDHNDIRDLDWMSVAVPYSNIVVSERYWGNKVRTTGLAAKYDTVLITSLQDLPSNLTAVLESTSS